MADWYVYQHDAAPLGPWSTDVVAQSILSGKLSPETWVAAPGGAKWTRALDIPVIAALVGGTETPRRPSQPGIRMVPGTFQGDFGGTVMMVSDDELEVAAESGEKTQIQGGYPGGGETLESVGNIKPKE